MSDLDPELVRIGQSADSMERRALALIGPVTNGYFDPGSPNLPGVCERSSQPLPHGCWDHGNRSPYSMYGDERWCNACIAYAALNGTLPRPEQQIEMTLARRLVPA